MELSKIIARTIPPKPWIEGEKIPWNDPEFSKRMLKEHLSQNHDAASRRFEIIEMTQKDPYFKAEVKGFEKTNVIPNDDVFKALISSVKDGLKSPRGSFDKPAK